ncbi:MAG: alginate lyase family protein [Planctomycetota bacterium]
MSAPLTPLAAPATLLARGDDLVTVRRRVARDDARLRPAVDRAVVAAAEAMTAGPFSVTDKTDLGPASDPHDYVSMATYAWPNPDTPDGLPWRDRDGVVQPLRETYDALPLRRMCHAVQRLTLACWVTGRDDYGARAAQLLRVWFLDEPTRMNPHLNHGQFVPGGCDGRCYGIIDTSTRFPPLLDAAAMLAAAGHWTAGDAEALVGWCRAYLAWLTDSPMGRAEGTRTNNHAVWYDCQNAALALFVGDRAVARRVLEGVRGRIDRHIEPDGSQPRELGRTRARHYTAMNLRAFVLLARLAEHVDIDLWRYRSDDGRSIRRAIDWLMPTMDGTRRWVTDEDVAPFGFHEYVPLLRWAANAYEDPACEALIGRLPNVAADQHRLNLIVPARTTPR